LVLSNLRRPNIGMQLFINVILYTVYNLYKNLLDPEFRGRSTGSMVTNFVLGITCSHKI